MASTYGTDANKSSLRSNYLQARKTIPALRRISSDELIAKSLFDFKLFAESPLVLTYVSYGAEVDTKSVIASLFAEGRRVAVPRCKDDGGLDFCEIEGLDELVRGAHGLLEPAPAAEALEVEDFVGSVCLVPGLVFDGDGHRVGYGGGCYDRFLAFYPGDKVGLARITQVSSNPLPADETDVPVDFLVTENGVWACK